MSVTVQHAGVNHTFSDLASARQFMREVGHAATQTRAERIAVASGLAPNLTEKVGWASEESGCCNRCGGSGQFKTFGPCLRCHGSGVAPGLRKPAIDPKWL